MFSTVFVLSDNRDPFSSDAGRLFREGLGRTIRSLPNIDTEIALARVNLILCDLIPLNALRRKLVEITCADETPIAQEGVK